MYHFIVNIDYSHQLLLRNPNETHINTKPICQAEKPQVLRTLTIANCRPMFPTVTPPEKNIHGSQERI